MAPFLLKATVGFRAWGEAALCRGVAAVMPAGVTPHPPVPTAARLANVGDVAGSAARVAVAVRGVEVVGVKQARVVAVKGGDREQVVDGE